MKPNEPSRTALMIARQRLLIRCSIMAQFSMTHLP
jgi:hypothetical protein